MTRKHATLLLDEIGCGAMSAPTVENALLNVPGVARAYVSAVTEVAYVEYDADQCRVETLVAAIQSVAAHPRLHSRGAIPGS